MKTFYLSIQKRMVIFFLFITIISVSLIAFPMMQYYRTVKLQDLQIQERQKLVNIENRIQQMLDESRVLTNLNFLSPTFQDNLDTTSMASQSNDISAALRMILINSNYIANIFFLYQGKIYFESAYSPSFPYHKNLSEEDLEQLFSISHNEMRYCPEINQTYSINTDTNHYVPFVRTINNTNTFTPIGMLVYFIDQEKLQQLVSNTDQNISLLLMDRAYNLVVSSNQMIGSTDGEWDDFLEQNTSFSIMHQDNGTYAYAKHSIPTMNWILLSKTALTDDVQYPYVLTMALGLLFILLVFVLLDFYIAFHISRPLAKVKQNMLRVQSGDFTPMEMKKTRISSEVTELQLFYNTMLLRLDALTKNIMRQGKRKRHNELLLLQEQIKPHFLYNTLDSISALNMMHQNELAYQLTTALSSFYRTNLSVAQAFISVQTEIECVKDYLTILNIRYGDTIGATFDVMNQMLSEQIPKLILQPLVENAVHHGIRQKRRTGQLHIRGYLDHEEIIFEVCDNGIGMSESQIEQALMKTPTPHGGFGLYHLQETLSLYGAAHPLQIRSKVGCYAKLTIRVPRNITEGGSHALSSNDCR